MKKKEAAFHKLHCLNNFLAAATGSQIDTFFNLQQAINFIIQENLEEDPFRLVSRFKTLTERLLELHLTTQKTFVVAHCDLSKLEFPDLLGIRLRLIEPIKQISGYTHAILIVTGLKEQFFPDSHKPSKKALDNYSDYLTYCQQFIADRVAFYTHLNVLFF